MHHLFRHPSNASNSHLFLHQRIYVKFVLESSDLISYHYIYSPPYLFNPIASVSFGLHALLFLLDGLDYYNVCKYLIIVNCDLLLLLIS
jgi:hypothetical protein